MEYYLYGDIDTGTAHRFNKLTRGIINTELPEHIDIYICSGGGEVEPACAIVDNIHEMQEVGIVVTTHVYGKAESSAAIIFCAGQHRKMSNSSTLMFHAMYWQPDEHNIHDAKSTADFFDRYYRGILSQIVDNCNLPFDVDYFYDKCRTDWWLNKSEALKLGFATSAF